jgi:hypothetical protein
VLPGAKYLDPRKARGADALEPRGGEPLIHKQVCG